MIKLKHNDKVILEGKRGRVFTIRGYVYCINQEPSILCGDPEFWGRINKEWAEAIQLNDGELVEIEDEILKVRYKGNYVDMGEFVYMNHTPIVKEFNIGDTIYYMFNIGDTIYYMANNEIHSAKIISKMKVENDPKHLDYKKETFTPFGEAGIYYATVHGIINGEKAFATKQELLNSL